MKSDNGQTGTKYDGFITNIKALSLAVTYKLIGVVVGSKIVERKIIFGDHSPLPPIKRERTSSIFLAQIF